MGKDTVEDLFARLGLVEFDGIILVVVVLDVCDLQKKKKKTIRKKERRKKKEDKPRGQHCGRLRSRIQGREARFHSCTCRC